MIGPLDLVGFIMERRKLEDWAIEADVLLSKYRLALEEIASHEPLTHEAAHLMQEIAQDALK